MTTTLAKIAAEERRRMLQLRASPQPLDEVMAAIAAGRLEDVVLVEHIETSIPLLFLRLRDLEHWVAVGAHTRRFALDPRRCWDAAYRVHPTSWADLPAAVARMAIGHCPGVATIACAVAGAVQ